MFFRRNEARGHRELTSAILYPYRWALKFQVASLNIYIQAPPLFHEAVSLQILVFLTHLQ